MNKLFFRLLCVFLILCVKESHAEGGCLIENYDPYNKIFTTPTTPGGKTFIPGNGNNFVRWENVCGPHTYVQTLSGSSGTCQVSIINRTGIYFPSVSAPFTRPCSLPLDDYIWILIFIVGGAFYYFLKKNQVSMMEV